MFKLAVVSLTLVAVSSAWQHNGFVSVVKHVPYKWYGGEGMGMGGGSMMGGHQMGMQGAMMGGSQQGGYQQGGEDYYAYPKYKFGYGVKDYHTGDHKSQWEMRDGDVVKGEYTLDEADGTKRIVSYHADSKNGFEAKVKNIGHTMHEGGMQQGGQMMGGQMMGGQMMGGQMEGVYGGAHHGHGYSYSKLKKYM